MGCLLFLNGLGDGEVIMILIFIIIFFGPKKIPELARGLGKGLRQVKDATSEIQREITREANEIKKDVDISKDLDLDKDLRP